MVGPDELAMWADFGERTVILWADTEQHIKVRITINMLTKNVIVYVLVRISKRPC